ncbi:unnamed protein product [Schistosoma curassoni]|uniref:Uncharacterized protein n=1 Tax=Schistosoma curassoni TaxID=6186 RepID=A0A183KIC5_9TREM|nr:unnamed protein product [Schistosoma curassoni]
MSHIIKIIPSGQNLLPTRTVQFIDELDSTVEFDKHTIHHHHHHHHQHQHHHQYEKFQSPVIIKTNSLHHQHSTCIDSLQKLVELTNIISTPPHLQSLFLPHTHTHTLNISLPDYSHSM